MGNMKESQKTRQNKDRTITLYKKRGIKNN